MQPVGIPPIQTFAYILRSINPVTSEYDFLEFPAEHAFRYPLSRRVFLRQSLTPYPVRALGMPPEAAMLEPEPVTRLYPMLSERRLGADAEPCIPAIYRPRSPHPVFQ